MTVMRSLKPLNLLMTKSSSAKTQSKSSVYRRRARLVGQIPTNMIQHLDIFVATLHKLNRSDLVAPFNYEYSSSLSKNQRLYRAKKIVDTFFGTSDDDENLKYWLDVILSYDALDRILSNYDFDVPPHLMPKKVVVTQVADELRSLFVSRDRTNQEQRVIGELTLEVIRTIVL